MALAVRYVMEVPVGPIIFALTPGSARTTKSVTDGLSMEAALTYSQVKFVTGRLVGQVPSQCLAMKSITVRNEWRS